KSAASWLRGLFGRGRDLDVNAAPTDRASAEELERFPLVDLSQLELDREVAQALAESVCRSIEGICIGRISANEITVAVKDPTSVHVYDHISYASQGQLRPTLVRADPLMCELAQEWAFRLPAFASQLSWLEWLERKKLEAETLDVKTAAEVTFGVEDITSPIISAVDRIIKEAISAGASDIHLETFELEMVVRYRIDGVLNEINTFESKEAAAIVKRVKILANLDIAQDRITQGGRISVAVAGQELDLRVSIVPVPKGESVVMRLLKKGSFNLTLRDLGFNETDEGRFRTVLSQPYGMVLVSGPTGSGKSTTLYASLAEIQRPDRKLLTIEDPIEYQMPRVTQVQVNNAPREEEKRVTFAKALREFLRQDPDVILVGEIRDAETAAISVQAALTGHMLLSTIHTNDSVGIVARLRDMGVEPYLIGSVLLGGVAQRLCRRICSQCREAMPVPHGLAPLLAEEGLAVTEVFHGRGCTTCHGTGYRGRLGLYEILEVGGEVRELISSRARDEEIREAARAHGFRTLLQDGLRKVANGAVTYDEVQRVCMSI
ncbi:MAG: type II/IV secretion system protein, partial [Proteobacteria bacterium]|nr:type II/IV secretion system protein [Pseudomonadota bacterium]